MSFHNFFENFENYSIFSVTSLTDTDKEEAFLTVSLYLEENDDEQITVGELVLKMKEYCGEDSYTHKYMKKRITEHFGNNVIITEMVNQML